MAIFEETLPASYAGISFLMDSSSITGGRKTVLKEFPNSNLQTVEDLGLRPRIYNIDAVINQDKLGENYKQRRDNFLRVLEKGGTDVLIHPVYGRISNVIVQSYTLNESFRSLGEARFSIVFALSTTEGTPSVESDSLSIVESSVEESISTVTVYASDTFSISNAFPANFTAAVEKVNEIADAFEENTSFLQVAADKIDEFTAELVEFQSNVAALVSSPNGLINSIDRLFSTVNGMYSDDRSTFEVLNKFSSFGDEDANSPIQETTPARIEKKRNQNILNNSIKSQALLLNYGNASRLDFATVSEVESFEENLEEQFQAIIQNADFDAETLAAITNTRTVVQNFFNDQKLNASQIVTVKTPTLPARVLAYQYYADSTRGFDIADLNEDANVSFIGGEVEVFTK